MPCLPLLLIETVATDGLTGWLTWALQLMPLIVDSWIVMGAMAEPGEGPRSPARRGQEARQRLAQPLPAAHAEEGRRQPLRRGGSI